MTQQNTVEELQAKFDALKGDFHAQETAVEARQKEQTKNANILEALKQELNELLKRTQGKLERGETLTADEYVELKQSDTGLKARIEYYEALAEDLENLVYNECKKLFDIQQKLIDIRSEIFYLQASEKISAFSKENTKGLNEIFSLLYLSRKYEANKDEKLSSRQATHIHLKNIIGDIVSIDSDIKIPDDLNLYTKTLTQFTHKTPAQEHLERFNKGTSLGKLFNKVGK